MGRKSQTGQRIEWRGTVEGRKNWRIRPMLLALEDRTLLSTFTVTNTAGSGTGSLPYEIGLANLSTGANTIDFSGLVFSTSKTITLKGTQLELSNTSGTQTIRGPAAASDGKRRRAQPSVPGRCGCHGVNHGTHDCPR